MARGKQLPELTLTVEENNRLVEAGDTQLAPIGAVTLNPERDTAVVADREAKMRSAA